MKSQQSAFTQLHLAAENGHLEACKLHILNAKAVIFIFVSKKLIIVHKSNKVFKIALLSLFSDLLLKGVIYLFLFCKTFEVTTICFYPTNLAAENGYLEACNLYILNVNAVMFTLVDINLITYYTA